MENQPQQTGTGQAQQKKFTPQAPPAKYEEELKSPIEDEQMGTGEESGLGPGQKLSLGQQQGQGQGQVIDVTQEGSLQSKQGKEQGKAQEMEQPSKLHGEKMHWREVEITGGAQQGLGKEQQQQQSEKGKQEKQWQGEKQSPGMEGVAGGEQIGQKEPGQVGSSGQQEGIGHQKGASQKGAKSQVGVKDVTSKEAGTRQHGVSSAGVSESDRVFSRPSDPALLKSGTGAPSESQPATLVTSRVVSEHLLDHPETDVVEGMEKHGHPVDYTPTEKSESYKERVKEAQAQKEHSKKQ